MIELPEGAEVLIYHYRPAEGRHPDEQWTRHELQVRGQKPAPKGGFTRVIITLPDGREFWGHAKCSKRDNFSRSKGRMIATGRALTEINKEV